MIWYGETGALGVMRVTSDLKLSQLHRFTLHQAGRLMAPPVFETFVSTAHLLVCALCDHNAFAARLNYTLQGQPRYSSSRLVLHSALQVAPCPTT